MEVRGGVADQEQLDRELPAWPLAGLFVLFPLWWVLGLAAFAIPLAAVPMAALLAVRGRPQVPRGFGVWLLFLVAVAVSTTMLDQPTRLVAFSLRAGNYLGATVAFVYVYNARRSLTVDKVVGMVIFFWIFVVVGGFLGVLWPDGRIETPLAGLLPGVLIRNEYVYDLVVPKFAQRQTPWGSPVTFTRPSAPFPYTNGWGCNYAMLLPFVLLAVMRARTVGRRVLVLAVLAASLVPAIATLNRGMMLAVGLVCVYAAVRLFARGDVRGLVGIGVLGTIAVVAGSLANFGEQVALRQTYSATTEGRAKIYWETFDRALTSPVLGFGAPRPGSDGISLGTQGHLFNVMFSHGFVALLLFEIWLLVLVWRSRSFDTAERACLHLVVVTALVAHVYYGFDGPQFVIFMVAAALAIR